MVPSPQFEIVTLIASFPLSAKSCAIVVSKTRQSEFIMADETPAKKNSKMLNVINGRTDCFKDFD